MEGGVRGGEPVGKETIDSGSEAKCNSDSEICVGSKRKMQRTDSGEHRYPNKTHN